MNCFYVTWFYVWNVYFVKKKKNLKPSLVHKESIIFKHIQIYPQSAIGTKNNLNFISYIASEGLKFSTGIVYEPLLWSF